MNRALRYILGFILIVLLQVLVLNNFQLFGYLNPKVYPLFILLLPAKTNRPLLLLIAFALGLTIDIFENSGGIHASATLFLAFIRPALIQLITNVGSNDVSRLNLTTLGIAKFLTYITPAVFIHHLWLFSLEAFTFRNYHLVLYETLISSAFSFLLMFILELLFNRKAE
ncbi:MAG: rod shape-determining protein MreD [Schleiferiaceae bacterium]|nr:rod shape-determining protein MreD [Schleiferiaceae bacterium]